MLRSPVVAGRFYAGTAEALASDVALCKKEGAAAAAAVPSGSAQPVAVMLPHAGHVYCGRVIGATLSGVRLPRLLVLLCPNHTGRGTPLSVWPGGAWRTPLGDVPCDDAFIASLTVFRIYDMFRVFASLSEDESVNHSVRIAVQYCLGPKIAVPMRTIVAPYSRAMRQSPDMPMDSSRKLSSSGKRSRQ